MGNIIKVKAGEVIEGDVAEVYTNADGTVWCEAGSMCASQSLAGSPQNVPNCVISNTYIEEGNPAGPCGNPKITAVGSFVVDKEGNFTVVTRWFNTTDKALALGGGSLAANQEFFTPIPTP